jgi:hypothetical protein
MVPPDCAMTHLLLSCFTDVSSSRVKDIHISEVNGRLRHLAGRRIDRHSLCLLLFSETALTRAAIFEIIHSEIRKNNNLPTNGTLF